VWGSFFVVANELRQFTTQRNLRALSLMAAAVHPGIAAKTRCDEWIAWLQGLDNELGGHGFLLGENEKPSAEKQRGPGAGASRAACGQVFLRWKTQRTVAPCGTSALNKEGMSCNSTGSGAWQRKRCGAQSEAVNKNMRPWALRWIGVRVTCGLAFGATPLFTSLRK
jgi:hypothetical protein